MGKNTGGKDGKITLDFLIKIAFLKSTVVLLACCLFHSRFGSISPSFSSTGFLSIAGFYVTS